MSAPSETAQEILAVCERWSQALDGLPGSEARRDFLVGEMQSLLRDGALCAQILRALTRGNEYPDVRCATMFDNEIPLYADKNRLFSVRLYLWAPGEYTPAHDHSAWGVYGPFTGQFRVVKYRLKESQPEKAAATLEKTGELRLLPGEVDLTLPLEEGIHKTGNPTERTIATLHVYGAPLRRLHINGYDPGRGIVFPIYTPRTRKRMLASQALESLG